MGHLGEFVPAAVGSFAAIKAKPNRLTTCFAVSAGLILLLPR